MQTLYDVVIILAQAQAGTTGTDIFAQILNYGVLGLVLVALIMRKLVIGGELDDKKEQIDKLEAKIERLEGENRELQDAIKSEILPSTFKATEALGDVADVNSTLIPILTKVARLLERSE